MSAESLLYVIGVLALLATIAVILRVIARRRTEAGCGADDFWIIFSLLPMYGMVMCGGFMVIKGGAGKPIATLQQSEINVFIQALFASMPTYGLAITMAKISVLLLYRGVFDTRPFRTATWIVGAACLAWLVAEVLTTAFQCSPSHEARDKMIPLRCMNLVAIYYAFSASNMFLDIVILCMPIRSACQLSLPRRQKITMLGIFLLGGLTCIAAVARIASVRPSILEDITLNIVHPYIYSTLEPAMAIICACLPTFRPLFIRNPSASVVTLKQPSSDIESSPSTDNRNTVGFTKRVFRLSAFHSIKSSVRTSFDRRESKSKRITVTEEPIFHDDWYERHVDLQARINDANTTVGGRASSRPLVALEPALPNTERYQWQHDSYVPPSPRRSAPLNSRLSDAGCYPYAYDDYLLPSSPSLVSLHSRLSDTEGHHQNQQDVNIAAMRETPSSWKPPVQSRPRPSYAEDHQNTHDDYLLPPLLHLEDIALDDNKGWKEPK